MRSSGARAYGGAIFRSALGSVDADGDGGVLGDALGVAVAVGVGVAVALGAAVGVGATVGIAAALAVGLDDGGVAVPQPATRRVIARRGFRTDVLEERSRDRVIESPSGWIVALSSVVEDAAIVGCRQAGTLSRRRSTAG
jgi:hypothetical protein